MTRKSCDTATSISKLNSYKDGSIHLMIGQIKLTESTLFFFFFTPRITAGVY